MSNEKKPEKSDAPAPKKGPAFEKPKEPEATPSKSAQKPLEVKPRPVEATAKEKPRAADPVVTSKEKPRSADPVVTSKEKPRVVDAGATTTQKPRAAFVEPSLAAVDALDCETLAICLCSDVRPLAGIAGYVDWRLCGRLSDLLRRGVVTGASKEKVLVPTLGRIGPTRIFLFGWGPQKSILDGATERLAWMVDVLLRAKVERVAIALPEPAVVLLGLVDEHVRKPLGDKCAVVFGPDQLLVDSKDTRPLPAPSLSNTT